MITINHSTTLPARSYVADARQRLAKVHDNSSTGCAYAAFLEPHECVVSNLVAYRGKDRAFAQALLHARLIDISALRSVSTLSPPRWTRTSGVSYIPGSTRRNSNSPTTTARHLN